MGGGFAGWIGGCVVWVRWAPHRFSGWYVGSDLSLGCSDFCFIFKNTSRGTVQWQWPLPQCNVFFTTWDNGQWWPDETSTFRVSLGVGGSVVVSGSCPSHSCDGWVGDLGVVGVSSIFGLIRGSRTFTVVLPTFVLVSRMHLAQQYRVNGQFLNTTSSSRHEPMVVVLSRVSALCVGLGVGGATIVSGSCTRPSHSWISSLLTSSLSLGISSLFCRATQSMWGVQIPQLYLLVSHRTDPHS